MTQDQLIRLINRLESSDPDFDDCDAAAKALQELFDTRQVLISAVSYLVNTSVPQTSQQEQCWPGLKEALAFAAKDRS